MFQIERAGTQPTSVCLSVTTTVITKINNCNNDLNKDNKDKETHLCSLAELVLSLLDQEGS